MDLEHHIAHTSDALGITAEDIHKWIDGYFDTESFRDFLAKKKAPGNYDPYAHRRFRHCREALQEAVSFFKGKYSPDTVKKVFYMHIRDDYMGYLPSRRDFDDAGFVSKYHKRPEPAQEKILSTEELEQYFKNNKNYHRPREKAGTNSFWLRIVFPVLITAVLFILFIFAFIIPDIRTVMMNDKKEMIRELGKSGASVIEFYIKKTKTGKMSVEQAQRQAKLELEKMRYGIQSKDYYWITDMHPVMLMHPYRQELVNKDLTAYRDHEDKSGKYLFNEAVELVRQNGEGFIEYYWQWMDNPDKSALKLSYVVGIPDWDWILGTGIYINDVEDDMRVITERFSWTAFILIAIVAAALSFVIIQSRIIEKKRRNAEAGLEEARDRYRLLAETANEGYVLVIDRRIIYANRKMQDLLDYSDQQLQKIKLPDLFIKDREDSFYSLDNLYSLSEKGPAASWIDIKLRKSAGDAAEVQLKVSRVYFSEKDAYLLTARTVREFQGSILVDKHSSSAADKDKISKNIEKSTTVAGCLFALEDLPGAAGRLESAEQKRLAIAGTYKKLCNKVIELQLPGLQQLNKDIKLPGFSFMHLGSNARNEMTFFSDQDNAFIFKDPENSTDRERVRRLFLDFNRRVCAVLKQAGFNYCPGGIQASNPGWCMSVSDWRRKIDGWFKKYDSDTMREIHVFADLEPNPADGLSEAVKKYFIDSTSRHQEFLRIFAESVLPFKTHAGDRLNVKELLKTIEITARIYSYQYGLTVSGTSERLKELDKINVLDKNLVVRMAEIFSILWDIRFRQQIESFSRLKKMDDTVSIKEFSGQDRKTFKNAVNLAAGLSRKLEMDFTSRVF